MKRGRPKIDHHANFRKAIQTDLQTLLKSFFSQKYLSFPYFVKSWETLQFSAIHSLERGKINYGQYLQCIYFEIFLYFCNQTFWQQFISSESLLLSQVSDPGIRMLIAHVSLFYTFYMIYMTQNVPSESPTSSDEFTVIVANFIPIRITDFYLKLFRFHFNSFTTLSEIFPSFQFLKDIIRILQYLFDTDAFIVSSSVGPMVVNHNPQASDHQWNYLHEDRIQQSILQFEESLKVCSSNTSSSIGEIKIDLSIIAQVFEVHPSSEDLQVMEAESLSSSLSSSVPLKSKEESSNHELKESIPSIESRRAAYFQKRQEKQQKLQERLQQKIEKLRKKIYRSFPSKHDSRQIQLTTKSTHLSTGRTIITSSQGTSFLPQAVATNLEAVMNDLSSIVDPTLSTTSMKRKTRVEASLHKPSTRSQRREPSLPVAEEEEEEEQIAFIEDEAEAMDWMNTMIRAERPAKVRSTSQQGSRKGQHTINSMEEVDAEQLYEAEQLLNQLTASVDSIMNEFQQRSTSPITPRLHVRSTEDINYSSVTEKNTTKANKTKQTRKSNVKRNTRKTTTIITTASNEDRSFPSEEEIPVTDHEVSSQHLLEIESLVNDLNSIVAEILQNPSVRNIHETGKTTETNKERSDLRNSSKTSQANKNVVPMPGEEERLGEESSKRKIVRKKRKISQKAASTAVEEDNTTTNLVSSRPTRKRKTRIEEKSTGNTSEEEQSVVMTDEIQSLLTDLEATSAAILSAYQS